MGNAEIRQRTLKERIRDASPGPIVALVHRLRYARHLKIKGDFLTDQARDGRYCFIHINKCGGTSVEKALNIPTKIHDTAQERRAVLGGARWEEMVSFSIVRHPYSRLVSDYRYRIKTNQSDMGRRQIGLNDWIARVLRDRDPHYCPDIRMAMPCHDWLCDETGKIIVNYVGKLETIDQDWQTIQSIIGVSAALPRENQTAGPKSDDGLSQASKDMIVEAFDKDFVSFGYQP